MATSTRPSSPSKKRSALCNLRELFGLALAVLSVGFFAPAWAASDFDAWAETQAGQRMRADPLIATLEQYFQGEEQARLDGLWKSASKTARLEEVKKNRQKLAELHSFDLAKLTPQQRVSAGLISWVLEQEIAAGDFLDNEYIFDHMFGLQVDQVNFMNALQPLRNARDVQSYLERLAGLAVLMDEGIERTRSAQAKGTLMPRFITEKVIAQFESFLAPRPADNMLVSSMAERMAKIDGLSDKARKDARAKAEGIMVAAVLPAWRRGLALMREQLPLTNDVAGAWRLQNGEGYYAAALRFMTSTRLTPAEIHEIGRAEVARIDQQMDGLLRQLGYSQGSIAERYRQLELDQQPKAADPRPELLARYTSLLGDAEARARLVFDVLPKAPVEVRREPALTEATMSMHYDTPARDGSRPGIFWVPLPGPEFEIVSMRTDIYHETVPGHHFQSALQQEAQQLPAYRRRNGYGRVNAYNEGWALYAEQLAVDQGWYEGDTVGLLGQLYWAQIRARRLVVDTGLHAMKWTRQQAIDYGMSETEIDRYIVTPGQACGYMIGRLKIEALRERAKSALGAKFDLRKFHNFVLLTGSVPLDVLESALVDWIKTQQG